MVASWSPKHHGCAFDPWIASHAVDFTVTSQPLLTPWLDQDIGSGFRGTCRKCYDPIYELTKAHRAFTEAA